VGVSCYTTFLTKHAIFCNLPGLKVHGVRQIRRKYLKKIPRSGPSKEPIGHWQLYDQVVGKSNLRYPTDKQRAVITGALLQADVLGWARMREFGDER